MFTHFPTTLPLLLITAWKLLDTETSPQSPARLPPLLTGPTLNNWHFDIHLVLFYHNKGTVTVYNFIVINSLELIITEGSIYCI